MPDPPGYGLHQPHDASAGSQARARNQGRSRAPVRRPSQLVPAGTRKVVLRRLKKLVIATISTRAPSCRSSKCLVPRGILITAGGRPVMTMAFTVADGAITAIRNLADPDRLAQVVPSWVT
jgi:hypothetical protein